ncbi:uncharacterized protein F4812DRAFT_211146 [Daldinia caldariorum]|uniref:uncharacterized protein n=1 Tax=Daldinia caldariorum TaxID=326644 RepID=UPI0020082C1A|nr:uncharacterized protein F4812DRAFT_211146 [Daldinia caldariorum]KAI1464414.1 hypothetical protein F4812DRAFT_211146 [Daldinia caldariorum]
MMEQPSVKYSNQRVPGKEHIPLYPKGFVAIRIIQLVVGIICLGLSAFGIVFLVFTGDALTLFTSIATLITSIYCLVAHFGPARAYNYWAILGLDIFLVIFWLVSFAILADQVASVFALYHSYASFYGDYYDLNDYDTAVNTYGGCLAAAAGLGGVEFVLYIISLSIHGVMLHRHRKAGLKAMPTRGVAGGADGLPAGGEKFQMQPRTTQVYQEQNTMGRQPPPLQGFYPSQSPPPVLSQPTGSTYVQPQQIGVPGQTQQYPVA